MNEAVYLFYRLIWRGFNDTESEKSRVIRYVKERGIIPMLAKVLSLTETDSPRKMVDDKVVPGDVESYNYCHVQKYCTTSLGILAMDPTTIDDIDIAIQSLYSEDPREGEGNSRATKSVIYLLLWEADRHNIGEGKKKDESSKPRPDRVLRAVTAQVLLRRVCSVSRQWQKSPDTAAALKGTLEMDDDTLLGIFETTLSMQPQLPKAAQVAAKQEATADRSCGLRESMHVFR